MLDASLPCPRCSSSAGPGHTFANLGGETCSGEPWPAHEPLQDWTGFSHTEAHDAARHCAEIFATYEPVGVQDCDDYVLLLANCRAKGCGSTIARAVATGGAEHRAFAQRCKGAA